MKKQKKIIGYYESKSRGLIWITKVISNNPNIENCSVIDDKGNRIHNIPKEAIVYE